MIGIILLGHGEFAMGLSSSLKLIAGEIEKFETIVFDGSSTDDLTADIDVAMNALNDCENILFLTDITGGSPFQTAAMKSVERDGTAVIGGTNLGMLIEAVLTRSFAEDFDSYVDGLVQNGKDAIAKFEIVERDSNIQKEGI